MVFSFLDLNATIRRRHGLEETAQATLFGIKSQRGVTPRNDVTKFFKELLTLFPQTKTTARKPVTPTGGLVRTCVGKGGLRSVTLAEA
jgi:hypothetical protein